VTIDLVDVLGVVARWWADYDEARFDAWAALVTHDVHFTCRSDTGATEYEEFIRADVRGREAFVSWQTEHRTNSPYPLRHHATNVHVTATRGGEADFASYLFVTHIERGVPRNLSSGTCTGTVRDDGGAPRLAALRVVLDTMDSVALTDRVLERTGRG
jgi:3-phenylpropionate/cinnamic acid dioxygenase small subunit